jgi:hypothetical protein
MGISGLFRELPLVFLSNTWLHLGEKSYCIFYCISILIYTATRYLAHFTDILYTWNSTCSIDVDGRLIAIGSVYLRTKFKFRYRKLFATVINSSFCRFPSASGVKLPLAG